MGFWDKLKRDIKKGIDEGLEALKESTEAIKHRAEDMTDEVKKKLKVFELKQKVQVQLTELGGRVYEVVSEGKRRNPLLDDNVKRVFERVKRLDEQISALEGKIAKKTRKTAKKATGRKKAAPARKSTARKTSTEKKTTRGRTKRS